MGGIASLLGKDDKIANKSIDFRLHFVKRCYSHYQIIGINMLPQGKKLSLDPWGVIFEAKIYPS